MKLIRELRRREVFRTTGLYVGIAWILIEGASVFLPAFEAPDWILRALIIIAIIGMPVTVVLAWVFDITESGIEVQAETTDTVVAPFGGRKGDFVVIGVLSVALVFSVYLNLTGTGSTEPEPIEPISVLIADFVNQTGDALFDGTLEQALQIGIESASFVTGYRREAAQRIASGLERGGDRLDEETARLVSVREGIKLVVAGSIEEVDGRYSLYARAIDPKGGEVLAKAEVDAKDKLSVLEAIGTLSGDLREELGDKSLDRDKLKANETFTAKSLEAAKAYAKAQSLQYNGKYADAIEYYRQAIEYDPEFGRAYSGWALSEQSLGRTEEAKALFEKALANLDTMTERERLRTQGLYFSRVTRNRQKAIESYSKLVEKFPADDAAHNGLAIQYFYVLDFQKALEAGKNLLDIYPNSVMGRSNYALYAMYAGDFETAVTQARRVQELDPAYFKTWLPIAMEALSRNDSEAAVDAFRQMIPTGNRGASTANLGLADVQMYLGNYAQARAILDEGIEEDEASGNRYMQSTKLLVMAESYMLEGDAAAAVATVRRAQAQSSSLATQVLAALLYLAAGEAPEAARIAAGLGANLQPKNRAYGKLINGLMALDVGDETTAIDMITAGLQHADLWLLRYYLGRAYLAAGYFAEALDEFTMCQNRHGEATAIFLDDLPTYRYVATIPYWLARAQEQMGMVEAARRNYMAFVDTRAAGDPLAQDARQRVQ